MHRYMLYASLLLTTFHVTSSDNIIKKQQLEAMLFQLAQTTISSDVLKQTMDNAYQYAQKKNVSSMQKYNAIMLPIVELKIDFSRNLETEQVAFSVSTTDSNSQEKKVYSHIANELPQGALHDFVLTTLKSNQETSVQSPLTDQLKYQKYQAPRIVKFEKNYDTSMQLPLTQQLTYRTTYLIKQKKQKQKLVCTILLSPESYEDIIKTNTELLDQ